GRMPVFDRQLTGDKRGPAIMAVFDDLQQGATVVITERSQSPVIEHQQVGLGQHRQQLSRAPIAFRHGKFLEEARETEGQSGQAFSPRLMAQGTAEPGFALLMTIPSWG